MQPLHDIECVALLREPVRRDLYLHVRRAGHPVGRDEAATAIGISRSLAAFHLDRMADAGLLEIEYRRLSGRSGRGAGRPAKLYRPGERRVRVSLPATRYALLGTLLAEALDGMGARGDEAASAAARAHGRALAAGELGAGIRARTPVTRLRAALEELGFEPERRGDDLPLRNCPFHDVAGRHPALVCGLNRSLIHGVAEGLDIPGARVEQSEEPGYCCVLVRIAGR